VAGRAGVTRQRTTLHHESHQDLLGSPFAVDFNPAPVNAIIVPTARSAPYLRHAISVAHQLRCPLIALCSRHAKTRALASLVDEQDGRIDFLALDLSTPGWQRTLPTFETSRMLAGTRFARRTDTGLKRNLGLALARMAGWHRVAFLDDDILVPDALDLQVASGLLDHFDVAGLRIGGFPDNSVVCHAHRDTGGNQDTFVGGGALVVPTDRYPAYFPEIYNEDWFFLLDNVRLRRTTLVGEVKQRPYDPYVDPDRARGQELGDVLAEGVFALLDCGQRVQGADSPTFWESFLERRLRFIQQVLDRIDGRNLSAERRWHMRDALKAALGRHRQITPELCVAYMRAWRTDRTRWRNFLAGCESTVGVDVALKTLFAGGPVISRGALG
jgi:hypothetical protein